MRRVYLLYGYWMVAGSLLGFGLLGLVTAGWPWLLAGGGMLIVGRLLRLSIH